MPFPNTSNASSKPSAFLPTPKPRFTISTFRSGDEALEVFGDIAESVDPSTLRPEHCAAIRSQLVERYLTRNHPQWLDGKPTPSFYRPRMLEGRASGVAIPLGEIRVATAHR